VTITSFEGDIVTTLASRCEDDQFESRSHEPIPWDVPVANCNMYAGIRHVVEQFAEQKGFTTGRGSRNLWQVIRILMAVTGEGVLRGSSYAIAEAMQYLSHWTPANLSVSPTLSMLWAGSLPTDSSPACPRPLGRLRRCCLQLTAPSGEARLSTGLESPVARTTAASPPLIDFVERDTDTKWNIQLSQCFVREGGRSHPDLEIISQGGLKAILRDVLNPAELTEEVSTALGSLD
jgi:hypothetical protein